jgi:hypothetical protein
MGDDDERVPHGALTASTGDVDGGVDGDGDGGVDVGVNSSVAADVGSVEGSRAPTGSALSVGIDDVSEDAAGAEGMGRLGGGPRRSPQWTSALPRRR